MPYNINFDELAIMTNIATDRLQRNIETYDAMAKLFPMLETEDQQIGLYGGTALNKVYFGKKQRLSYDLDLFCYSYETTLSTLKKNGAVQIPSKVASGKGETSRFMFQGIRLDLWRVKSRPVEEPKKREATDLLYYYNYLIPKVVVPTYSLEYLLAEKTMAMANRNELKDIYDTWMGLQVLENKTKYTKFLRIISKKEGISDYKYYFGTQIYVINKSIDYYKEKKIDVLYQPNVAAMIKDISAALKL